MENRIEKLKELSNSLKEKGVDVDKLTIFLVNSDQIIGEVVDILEPHTFGLSGVDHKVKNPKRIIRLQQLQAVGVSINLMLGDLDLLSEGVCNITAGVVYRVKEQSVESQIDILSLYQSYFERKLQSKAIEAGLTVPKSPFAKR